MQIGPQSSSNTQFYRMIRGFGGEKEPHYLRPFSYFGDLVFQTKKVLWVTLILHEKEEKDYCFIIFPFFICFHDCNISKCQHSKWSVLFNIGLCYSRGCWTALHIDTVIRCGIVVHCIHSFYYRQYFTILQFLKLIV